MSIPPEALLLIGCGLIAIGVILLVFRRTEK
jgi:uncharacterized protein YjeT (DUF2065 family)